ncbi:Pogo transposable element with KRAB domain [Holothuria leucospilota]|uniref:Pogo transposable element with KRAB domain n=1 Tax=Holothuria leucospilota TaxID=206669 RepID=A0A9Q1BJW9_HOLLE|nr:Pogo transposable element with KRAB domain [Holothuria leucospilota]
MVHRTKPCISDHFSTKMYPKQKKRCSYDKKNMSRAVKLVLDKRISKRRAAKMCGVPESTLRALVKRGKDTPMTGKASLIPEQHERQLKDHIIHLAKIGFPLSHSGVLKLANNTAVFLNLRKETDKPLSVHWFRRFMRRWPDLQLVRPQKLGMRRAAATSEKAVSSYFKELEEIFNKYDLKEKPHLIYNIDETGFQYEHEPQLVVAKRGQKVNNIVTDRGDITTVLAAGNAIGQAIPPYFIFKGQRLSSDLKTGTLPGSGFRMTRSGWSNGEVFMDYIQNHITKYMPSRSDNDHVLFLYDGHKSHISLPLIEFALTQKIILFVLPPHTSHILQPLDVSVFGPLKRCFHSECQRYMHQNPGERITRYQVGQLISRAYQKSFTSQNLISAFRKTGVFPFNPTTVDKDNFLPAEFLQSNNSPSETVANPATLGDFLTSQIPTPREKKSKKRQYAYRPGGVAITESKIILKLRKVAPNKDDDCNKTGPSKPYSPAKPMVSSSDDEEVCCVCKRFSPPNLRDRLRLEVKFVDWTQCGNCGHWVHLDFCVPLRKDDVGSAEYLCPHCGDEE